jgi:hypothetical protein
LHACREGVAQARERVGAIGAVATSGGIGRMTVLATVRTCAARAGS